MIYAPILTWYDARVASLPTSPIHLPGYDSPTDLAYLGTLLLPLGVHQEPYCSV